MAEFPSRSPRDGGTSGERATGPTSELLATPRAEPSAELEPATAPRQPGPARWSPTVRPDHPLRQDLDPATWPVGFSPTGEALPETLTDVLLRGSHAIRSSKRAEAQRLERAAAVAEHVEAQIQEFLAFCAAENLTPPVTVRANGRRVRPDTVDRPGARPLTVHDLSARDRAGRDRAGRDRAGRRGRSPADRDRVGTAAAGAPPTDGADDSATGDRGRGHREPDRRRRALRRERLHAWPLLYWRCESFPAPGRSLHLFVEPGGRTFEGRDDPAPLTVLGREVQVWQVDAPSIVEGMAEVDARRCALHLVHGMAHMLWRAGVGL